MKRLIEHAIGSAGIRGKLGEGQHRHEFKATHGFRKFFDTVCERHMKTLHVEQLLDHDTGLKESYNRPTEDDLLKDYLKAVPELTILAQVAKAVSEDIEDLKRQISELTERQRRFEEYIQRQAANYSNSEELDKMAVPAWENPSEAFGGLGATEVKPKKKT